MASATSTPVARSMPSRPGELLISRIFGPAAGLEHVDAGDLQAHHLARLEAAFT
jgi:hypothetical protein